jgi:hypothetical protein
LIYSNSSSIFLSLYSFQQISQETLGRRGGNNNGIGKEKKSNIIEWQHTTATQSKKRNWNKIWKKKEGRKEGRNLLYLVVYIRSTSASAAMR